MQKLAEYVLIFFLQDSLDSNVGHRRGHDEDVSQRKALETLVAGQKAENLLDFDDAPAEDGQPTGLAATQLTSTPAAASLIAGTSSNPLDDLVSIFGGTGIGGSGGSGGPTNGLDFLSSPVQNAPPSNGALSDLMSPVSAAASPSPAQAKPQAQQEDLLGLF